MAGARSTQPRTIRVAGARSTQPRTIRVAGARWRCQLKRTPGFGVSQLAWFWAAVATYMAVACGIGLWHYRRASNEDGFHVAGRSLAHEYSPQSHGKDLCSRGRRKQATLPSFASAR